MIEVKKTLQTARDRERALEQASFYVRGWTQRSERAARRGPVILVVTQASAGFEADFNVLVASSGRPDLPHLILAAGFR